MPFNAIDTQSTSLTLWRRQPARQSASGGLIAYAEISEAISGAIREIVRTGTLSKLDKLRDAATPELTDISRYPRLDPERVFRIYKKLGITSVEALKEELASGDIEKTLGRRWPDTCVRA